MECPTCKTPFQPGDKFCGTCGERLPDVGAAPAAERGTPPAPMEPVGRDAFGAGGGGGPALVAAPPSGSGAARGMPCPTCGGPLAPGQTKCQVCGMDVMPAGTRAGGDDFGAARGPAPAAARAGAAYCPIHGEMDPTWTRCPHCLKEGREGRLATPSGGVPRGSPDAVGAPPPQPDPYGRAPAGPGYAPPPPAAVAPPPPPVAQAPRTQDAATVPPPRATVPPQPAPQPPRPPADDDAGGGDRPVSSVGRTVVVRRRPRALAYLIEKEGEQVGRPFQLEEDVTDIGRDPRNHVVVNDVMVSAFHARVERAPDGSFLVQDRGSTNGTRVNSEMLTDRFPIDENDEIGVGNTTLVLKVVR